MIRQIRFLIFYGACAALGLWLLFSHQRTDSVEKRPAVIATAATEFRPIEQLVRVTGEVVASQATEIRSEVSGRIAKLYVEPGDAVHAGDVLLELDSAELQSEYQAATFRVDASRLRQEKAQVEANRRIQLRTAQVGTQKELEDAQLELKLANNALEVDGAQLQTIKERLLKTTLRAPHDGTVLNLRVREGVVVIGAVYSGEATLLMQIADLNQLLVQSEINELDMMKVAPKMPVRISFDSIPGLAVPGSVQFVSPSALPKDKDRTVRVFPLTVSLGEVEPQVKPGITATVTIATATNPRTLAVSVAAVFVENNEPFVYVKNGDAFAPRPVQLGISDGTFVEIRRGLAEGEQVALQRPPQVAAAQQPQLAANP
jgi:HlyD family secretion protein